jgi:dihydroorotate dehydrogenase electron transfer subunit
LFIIDAPIEETVELGNKIVLSKLFAPEIAKKIKPGQFVNIKVSETITPLLRRPFSICDVEGSFIYIMFQIIGDGTKILANKSKGESVNVLGPLGNGFSFEGDYDTAVIAAGGLGAAPFAFFIKQLPKEKELICFSGGRSASDVIDYGMKDVLTSTDDGSLGFKGNVVELMKNSLPMFKGRKIKIFGCGPVPMLKSLKSFALENNFECEVSTESAMACGFGICQGCPIPSAEDETKNLLVCKDGPVFNAKDIIL